MKKTQKVILGREYKSLEVCDNQTSAGNKPECPVMLLSPKGSGLDQRERERDLGKQKPRGKWKLFWRIRNDCMKKGALELGLGRMNRSLQTEKVGHAN